MAQRTLVIGVGNTASGDDGVGPAAVSGLAGQDLAVLVREGDLADLALCWRPSDDVFIVDACSSDRQPGDVFVVDNARLATRATLSTHGLGVADAVQLARHLGKMPASLTVVGIEGCSFAPGPMSTTITARLPTIVEQLRVIIRQRTGRSDPRSSSQ